MTMKIRLGNKTLIKGVKPNIIPKFGKIDEMIKKPIPMNSPIIMRLLV